MHRKNRDATTFGHRLRLTGLTLILFALPSCMQSDPPPDEPADPPPDERAGTCDIAPRLDARETEPQPRIGDPCEGTGPDMQPFPDDDQCAVVLKNNFVDNIMRCHPTLHVCVRSCASDIDCHVGWKCSGSISNLDHYCGNPLCGL
jgi:hypothetical protein